MYARTAVGARPFESWYLTMCARLPASRLAPATNPPSMSGGGIKPATTSGWTRPTQRVLDRCAPACLDHAAPGGPPRSDARPGRAFARGRALPLVGRDVVGGNERAGSPRALRDGADRRKDGRHEYVGVRPPLDEGRERVDRRDRFGDRLVH